jgi:hypothetical protein
VKNRNTPGILMTPCLYLHKLAVFSNRSSFSNGHSSLLTRFTSQLLGGCHHFLASFALIFPLSSVVERDERGLTSPNTFPGHSIPVSASIAIAPMLRLGCSVEPFDTSFSNFCSRPGKMYSSMTFMLGAHATVIARWFSMTAQIIVMAKRRVKSGRVACLCTKKMRAALAATTRPPSGDD